ncbi:MAG: uroporphyrinogen-III C-methyltransferase [Pseudomonadota bacterium]
MSPRDKPLSESRIPLVSGAVVAVRSRPYLAYLLAVLALALGVYVWQMAAADARALRAEHEQLAALENRVGELRRQQQRLLDDLALKGRQLDELGARLSRLDDTLNADQRRAWLVNEADHYLRMAQQHLLLTRDVEGARALLEVADRLLAAHADNRLLPLRQALARDRLALTTALAVDVPGTYLRIGALSERIAAVPLPAQSGGRGRQRGDIVAPETAPAAGALEAGWAKLRSLVVLRRYDEPLQPLLSDADRALVREGLRLDLAQAQLALMRGEPAIYQGSLAAAKGRLARYYAQLPQAEYLGLLQELSALAAVDIRPALPSLDASLRALDALSAQSAHAPAALPAGKAP